MDIALENTNDIPDTQNPVAQRRSGAYQQWLQQKTAAAKAVAEKEANKAVQVAGVGEFFWGTFWIPLASYAWSIANFAYKRLFAAKLGTNTTLSLLSPLERLVNNIMNVVWILALIFTVIMIAEFFCHGGIATWALRTAINIGNKLGLFGFNTSFCSLIPDFNIF